MKANQGIHGIGKPVARFAWPFAERRKNAADGKEDRLKKPITIILTEDYSDWEIAPTGRTRALIMLVIALGCRVEEWSAVRPNWAVPEPLGGMTGVVWMMSYSVAELFIFPTWNPAHLE